MAYTIVSDSVAIDTSRAPWMAVAQSAKAKGITEEKDLAKFKDLVSLELAAIVNDLVEPYAFSHLPKRNPEIAQYLKSVNVSPTVKSTESGWQMHSWCAAFVNWCLVQASSPTLRNSRTVCNATAAAWMKFGTPMPAPVFGCVVVFKPMGSTGSSTGHVAFYTGRLKGKLIYVLGGNQSGKVQESGYSLDKVRGYRWPTEFNHLLTSSSPIA